LSKRSGGIGIPRKTERLSLDNFIESKQSMSDNCKNTLARVFWVRQSVKTEKNMANCRTQSTSKEQAWWQAAAPSV
jgi:hypothetical protein